METETKQECEEKIEKLFKICERYKSVTKEYRKLCFKMLNKQKDFIKINLLIMIIFWIIGMIMGMTIVF